MARDLSPTPLTNRMMRLPILALAGVLLAGAIPRVAAAEYFVTKESRDGNAGKERSGDSISLGHEPGLDFDSFFATNPDLDKRGIGQQREAFKDFHFDQPSSR